MAARASRTGMWCWTALLLAPAFSVFSVSHSWDASPLAALSVSVLCFAALLAATGRWFPLVTCPIALFGLVAVAADALRGVDLLELFLVTGGGRIDEVWNSARPYAIPLATLALVTAGAAVWLCGRWPRAPFRRRWALLLALAAAAVATVRPAAALRAWPVNAAASLYARNAGRTELLAALLPYSPIDPRNHAASWEASRADSAGAARETYVLVIGESVRADRLRACGGSRVPAPAAAILVACDVMAASSSTHTSVPLLVSRTAPGAAHRVPHDATFMRAFEEAGFHTRWIAAQEREIAWPDGNAFDFAPGGGTDTERLLPHVERALAQDGAKQLIVVHAYGAHFRYCDRYAHASTPPPVDCRPHTGAPRREDREEWLESYDRAVAESMRFIDALVSRLERAGGEAFMLYVPDHGENLMDDDRALFQHALKEPTRWDTRVPMVMWGNAAWRRRNEQRWSGLAAAAARPLMHGDVVPTLLGAAGIRYSEPRSDVVDLTLGPPPPHRQRAVLRRIGEVVDGDAL